MHDPMERATALLPQLTEWRQYLHQHPELGTNLPMTCAFVEARLREMGYDPQPICEGGLVAVLEGGKPGKTILLRADMDALPMDEENDHPFKSQNPGAAHTCGHDIHTAMLLGAAKLLMEDREELCGRVKFMFQPNEEGPGGALLMIESGILENPHVDAAMGAHMIPMIPAGLGGSGTGVVSASSDHLVIRVEGRGGHGAHPQSTVDPINIGVHIHLALQELLSREADPAELVVLTFGKFQGGDAANIIPSSAVLEGTLRTFSEPLRTHLLERIDTICTCTAEAFRGRAQVTDLCSTCSLQIDGDTAAAVAQGWQREGLKMLQRGEKMSGSEDFAEIAARVPSTFFVVGGGTAQDGCGVSLHNPKIRFREEALIYGAAAYASGAAMWLELH